MNLNIILRQLAPHSILDSSDIRLTNTSAPQATVDNYVVIGENKTFARKISFVNGMVAQYVAPNL